MASTMLSAANHRGATRSQSAERERSQVWTVPHSTSHTDTCISLDRLRLPALLLKPAVANGGAGGDATRSDPTTAVHSDTDPRSSGILTTSAAAFPNLTSSMGLEEEMEDIVMSIDLGQTHLGIAIYRADDNVIEAGQVFIPRTSDNAAAEIAQKIREQVEQPRIIVTKYESSNAADRCMRYPR